jgi:hypothetical protein
MAKDRPVDRPHASGTTHIEISSDVLRQGVQRMGINLGDQEFYGSGQMMKNLVARNPGFEGKTWQSILHCRQADFSHCTDGMQSAVWSDNFWQGASYEVISGAAEGRTGRVTASRKADPTHPGQGVEITLDGSIPLHADDYLVVRKRFPGNAEAGWWVENGGGRLDTEFHDLSPLTPGRQALRIEASGAGQSMAVASFFDSTDNRSFLRINGRYRLTFRAKLLSGNPQLHVAFSRQTNPETQFYLHDIPLTNTWQDYSFDFDAHEPDGTIGALRLRFGVAGTSLLLDDVSLERIDGDASNNTAFRDEVVSALIAYRPGVLRYMASTTGLGSSVENLEAPEFARERSDYSAWSQDQPAVPYGLTDFLQLCVRVQADPWIILPSASSPAEAAQLIGWLKDRGWTQSFSHIHIEFGNEAWNSVFYGETFEDSPSYGHRASVLFTAMRHARGFDPVRFDLIAGGFIELPDRNAEVVSHANGADSLAVAPYLLRSVNDESSSQALFDPLFAQPQQMTQPGGLVALNRAVAAAALPRPLHLAVYEVNLHTTEGTISQAGLDRLTPSLGAGLAVAEHMLLMLRDDGVTTQALFSLPGYNFKRNDGKLVKLWGTVVDMGVSNRRRPQFLALQMVNSALLGNLLQTHISGYDPVFTPGASQPAGNNSAHEIESFAFAGAGRHSLVLLNLSLTEQQTVVLDGANAPHQIAQVETLDAPSVESNNEDAEGVAIRASEMDFSQSNRITLPPHSMITLSW